mmetsp:Transcript_25141/g.57498  ORF Transcript_25141/g.57498 Transcript_25141/m.57498 type:complete len:81 (-) Transcript_25141:51-293(-)
MASRPSEACVLRPALCRRREFVHKDDGDSGPARHRLPSLVLVLQVGHQRTHHVVLPGGDTVPAVAVRVVAHHVQRAPPKQ